MPAVESSAISRIAYQREGRVLSVWFKDSAECYRYFNVPEAVYNALLNATSKGRYLNAYIKDRYDFCRSAA
jgi:hypothetical protein